MANSDVSTMRTLLGNPVVGATTPSALDEVTRAICSGYRQNDTYETSHEFPVSSEGLVSIEKSINTGKLFVCKHTTAIKAVDGWAHNGKGYRYPNEARIMAKHLRPHWNIVSMMEILEDQVEPGRYRIYMEYCDGGNVYDQVGFWTVKRKTIVPEQFLLHLFAGLADGLAYLHHGLRYRDDGNYTADPFHDVIVHGDIKPDNVFLRWSDRNVRGLPDIVIGDFGTAKIEGEDVKVNLGTWKYHAPEDQEIYGSTPYDWDNRAVYEKAARERKTPSDVYACGQIMYMIAAKAGQELHIGIDPATLSISREYDTPGLREAILSCLAVDPKARARMAFGARGLLPVIRELRKARDVLLEKRWPLGPTEWLMPRQPKPEQRRQAGVGGFLLL